MKTHWKKVFNRDYLGSCDLIDGKDMNAVISHIETKEIDNSTGKKAKCNIAVFTGKVKPMVLNVTNSRILAKFAGTPFIEAWKNLDVTIYVDDKVKAYGDVVEGLRFRTKQPKIKKEILTPSHPKWIDAVEYLKKPDSTSANILKYWDVSEENIKKLLADSI